MLMGAIKPAYVVELEAVFERCFAAAMLFWMRLLRSAITSM